MKYPLCALLGLLCALPAHADEQLRRVQEELRKRNLYWGEIDGRKTRQLEGALKKYQERKGFTATGAPDEVTLRSLELLPALPVTAASLWPEMPVLKSDGARAGKEAATPPPIAEPTALPENFGEERAREFIKGYLKTAEANDLKAEMSYYGDPLDYFDNGVVEPAFVERDVRAYYKRWPHRKYELVNFSAEPSEDRPGEAVARFRIRFSVKSEGHSASGQTDNVFAMRADGERYKIVAMRESRVRVP